MSQTHAQSSGLQGPWSWFVWMALGAVTGLGVAGVLPAAYAQDAVKPEIPLWLVAPFAALLLGVAVMPFVAKSFWHHRYPEVSLFLGGVVAAYMVRAFDRPGYEHGMSFGSASMLHAGIEYYSFIALVGGLFLASGGILVDVRGRGGPWVNGAMLFFGAALANAVGTTGASVLLIRPFMRINRGRLTPMHILFFIFIVSNCGGSLTPIGDPPLYLGFLKGVPFFWTLVNLWPDWLLVIGLLVSAFVIYDFRVGPGDRDRLPDVALPGITVKGRVAILGMCLLILGVFIDPVLKSRGSQWGVEFLQGLPVGATFQLVVALGTFALSSKAIREQNGFNLEPIKEVGLLFAGIFATMAPALAYLATHGKEFGLDTPTAFYAGTGVLSAVLDNAPTYMNFVQIAVGDKGAISPPVVAEFLATPTGPLTLHAISTAAVFFGAMTYIGNGPNFMVKAIAESSGVKMPSFFGYLLRAVLILLPVLVIHWAVFVR